MKPIPCLLLPAYCAFAVSVVWWLGLGNMAEILEGYWQFLDLDLLRSKPYESLLYLNSQPPLLNFIVWILALLPGSTYENFILLNAACMAWVGLLLHVFTSRFLPAPWAFGVVMVYLVSPAVLLNIGYPFYPCLTTLGYAVLVYAFYLPSSRVKLATFVLLSSIGYLSLLRSSFSILHALFFMAVYLAVHRRSIGMQGRVLLLVATVVLSCAVPLKNLSLYGFFSASSWTPMNLARGAMLPVPLNYFPTPEQIRAEYPDLQCAKVYGIQDSEDKKRNGFTNYNSCIFIEYVKLAKKYMAGRYDLSAHLTQVGHNVAKYLSPPDRYWGLLNRQALLGYSEFVDRYVFLSVPWPKTNYMRLSVVMTVIGALFVCWRSKDRLLAFCLLLLAVHFSSHVLTDGIESERFVFDIEFVFFVLFSACLGVCRRAILTLVSPEVRAIAPRGTASAGVRRVDDIG